MQTIYGFMQAFDFGLQFLVVGNKNALFRQGFFLPFNNGLGNSQHSLEVEHGRLRDYSLNRKLFFSFPSLLLNGLQVFLRGGFFLLALFQTVAEGCSLFFQTAHGLLLLFELPRIQMLFGRSGFLFHTTLHVKTTALQMPG